MGNWFRRNLNHPRSIRSRCPAHLRLFPSGEVLPLRWWFGVITRGSVHYLESNLSWDPGRQVQRLRRWQSPGYRLNPGVPAEFFFRLLSGCWVTGSRLLPTCSSSTCDRVFGCSLLLPWTLSGPDRNADRQNLMLYPIAPHRFLWWCVWYLACSCSKPVQWPCSVCESRPGLYLHFWSIFLREYLALFLKRRLAREGSISIFYISLALRRGSRCSVL